MTESFEKPADSYQVLFEINPLPLWIYDVDTLQFLAVNQAAVDHYGYTREEFLSMTIVELRPPQDFPAFHEYLRSESKRDTTSGATWRHRKKDGGLVDVQITTHPLRFEGKDARLVLCNDITDWKRNAERLREREALFRAIFDWTSLGVCYVDVKERCIASNAAMQRLLGYSQNELSGMPFQELTYADDIESQSEMFHRLIEGRVNHFRLEKRYRRRDGTIIWGNLSVSAAQDVLEHPRFLIAILEDITEFKKAQEALRESKERYRRLVELSPDAIFVSTEGRIVFINRAGVKLFGGVNAEQIIGKSVLDFVHPDDHELVRTRLQQLEHSNPDLPMVEERIVRLNGEMVDAEVASIPFLYQNKPAVQAVVRDITKRRRAEEALRNSEERYRAFVEQSSEAIWRFELERPVSIDLPEDEQIEMFYQYGYMGECNDVMAQMYGFSKASDITGAKLGQLLLRSDPNNAEYLRSFVRSAYRLVDAESHEVDKYGEPRYFSNNLVGIVEDGLLIRVWGTQRDITDRKHAEEMIRHLAYHDSLTGLPNRMLFQDRFRQALVHSNRNQEMLAMLFLDLDRFKTINDTLGHAVGDKILKAVAERLAVCLREGDTVARLGGDEFMILVAGVRQVEDAAKIAEKIIEALRPSFHVDAQELHVTTSIGISLYPFDGKDAETLVKNADIALYRAKEHGRDHYQLYAPAMNERALEKLSLENNLRRALEREEFVLHYQPMVNLRTGQVVGVEALARWRRPGGQTLLPYEFIHIAEDTGLIVPLGEWVMRTACAQAKEWQRISVSPPYISVNLSARQFQQQNLTEIAATILRESGLDPALLRLELTESTIMKNPDLATDVLNRLKAMGIESSIDDFGTGYSSLSYLKRFPITSLKIDQSFVRDCMNDADDAAIVSAIISMAHSLKLKVVAEGVETEGQLAFLQSLNCDIMQGALFSEPLEPDAVEFLIQQGTYRNRIENSNWRN